MSTLRGRSEFLSPEELAAIHDASMALLANVGVAFHSDQALGVFQKHGLKLDGRRVFFKESQVLDAVAAAPPRFVIRARNPDNDVVIGDDGIVFAPGYGAPFLMESGTGRRLPTLDDYHTLMRLADALPNQDMSGHMLVLPNDVPDRTAHLHMNFAAMIHSDKPFIGSSEDDGAVNQTMEMAELLFDESPDSLRKRPVTMGVVNSLSPLSYGEEMIEALLAYGSWRQPIMIAALVMAGATGPITLAGVLAQQNAEILAGITLSQLANPGTPVIYGTTSAIMDMRSGELAIGSPELSMIAAASAQVARRYGLPCRCGGALTEANSPDAQAGLESMFGLLTAANSGADIVIHAAGILSSYLAFSFEKFVIDDEMCGMVRHYCQGLRVNQETLASEVIANVGPGGNFLMEAHTVRRCHDAFWQPLLNNRDGLEAWMLNGQPDTTTQASLRWQALLAEHVAPPMDAMIRRQLEAYMMERGCW
ncbi:MAG: trimethylamine methyltransferase family protein [Chloroflexota bacterium]|nr:MAG: trimethylamine methyltransferase family protein [Chloroflexota bacterium]